MLVNSSIAIGIGALVKYNNGFFVSNKQKEYLLSKCSLDGSIDIKWKLKNRPCRKTFYLDNLGVTMVILHQKTDKVIQWQRRVTKQDSCYKSSNIEVLPEPDTELETLVEPLLEKEDA